MKENVENTENSEEPKEFKDDKTKLEVEVDASIENKLQEVEDKLLRSLAEIENQRRRFEKDIKDAFDYGAFNFAKENLAILDNLQRARLSIQNDESLKDNQD